MHEAKAMGIQILPPDINQSEISFTARNGNIVFGLQGIRHVGSAALDEILRRRAEKPFTTLLDFCLRVDLRVINKRVIESLIFAGAFDKLGGSRAQHHTALSSIIELATHHKHEMSTGQLSLFGAPSNSDTPALPTYALPTVENWPITTILEREKEVVGLFLSGHPLDRFEQYITALTPAAGSGNALIIRCGMIISKKVITTKKGDPMAFLMVEHRSSTLEVILFPKVFRSVEAYLSSYTAFAIKGILDTESSSEKLKAQELIPLELLAAQGLGLSEIIFQFPTHFDDQLLPSLKALIVPGSCRMTLQFTTAQGPAALTTREKITLTPELMQFAQAHSISVRCAW